MSEPSDEASVRAGRAELLVDKAADREVITPDPGHSVRWFEHDYPTPLARWNYHPEYEIHLIRTGTGRFIVGDHVGTFEPGQVFMIGSGLPHDWVSYLEHGEVITNRDALVQFDGAWLESCMKYMPELTHAIPLLEESARGILFLGHTAARATECIELMGVTKDLERLSHLVTLLAILAGAPQAEKLLLAREWFSSPADTSSKIAAEQGLDYIFQNLTNRVSLSEAARRAQMSEATFSRYFARASGHSFTTVVRKLRISHARILLEQTTESIASICYQVGFSNLSNFNRQFRSEVHQTPREYRRTWTSSQSLGWQHPVGRREPSPTADESCLRADGLDRAALPSTQHEPGAGDQ